MAEVGTSGKTKRRPQPRFETCFASLVELALQRCDHERMPFLSAACANQFSVACLPFNEDALRDNQWGKFVENSS